MKYILRIAIALLLTAVGLNAQQVNIPIKPIYRIVSSGTTAYYTNAIGYAPPYMASLPPYADTIFVLDLTSAQLQGQTITSLVINFNGVAFSGTDIGNSSIVITAYANGSNNCLTQYDMTTTFTAGQFGIGSTSTGIIGLPANLNGLQLINQNKGNFLTLRTSLYGAYHDSITAESVTCTATLYNNNPIINPTPAPTPTPLPANNPVTTPAPISTPQQIDFVSLLSNPAFVQALANNPAFINAMSQNFYRKLHK